MSVKEYLENRIGQNVGIIRSGLPKECMHRGKLLRVESDMAVIEDDENREWAIPLDKILLIGPPESEDDDRPAGFRGIK